MAKILPQELNKFCSHFNYKYITSFTLCMTGWSDSGYQLPEMQRLACMAQLLENAKNWFLLSTRRSGVILAVNIVDDGRKSLLLGSMDEKTHQLVFTLYTLNLSYFGYQHCEQEMKQRLSCLAQWMQSDKKRFLLSEFELFW